MEELVTRDTILSPQSSVMSKVSNIWSTLRAISTLSNDHDSLYPIYLHWLSHSFRVEAVIVQV